MSNNKKQLIRIIVCLLAFCLAVVVFHFVSTPFYIELSVYAIIYLFIGYEIVFGAIKKLIKGSLLDENFLMTVATIGAFCLRDYKEAVFVMLFFQVGSLFENFAVNKSRKSIKELLKIRPETATILVNGKEQIVPPRKINVGDIIIVKAGERVAVDGVVVEGSCQLDTSALTGESLPKDCLVGDEVYSGTINLNGVIKIKCEKLFEDSTVSRILEMVETAVSKKSVTEKFITKFSYFYTPIVVCLAVLVFLIPSLITGAYTLWLKRALMFLVVSCPCALVISVPLGFFCGIGVASKYGILFKGGNYLEALAKTNVFVFDKTGTLTNGKFSVSEISGKREEVLSIACMAESSSNHPIARAIIRYDSNVCYDVPTKINEVAGKGMIVESGEDVFLVGSSKLLKENSVNCPTVESCGTVVFVARNKEYLGYIVVSDTVKDCAKEVVLQIKNQSKSVVMLTGDREAVARSVGAELGINSVYSSLLPTDKVTILEDIISKKQKKDKVAFIGDGINDAPALSMADVGIAMGEFGSDCAIESADVVLMRDDLRLIIKAQKIAQRTMRLIKQTICFSLLIKSVVLVLSAIGLSSMWLAVFADVGVSVLAILNVLRINKKNKI